MSKVVYLRQLLSDNDLKAIKKNIMTNIDGWSDSPMSPDIDVKKQVTFVKIVEESEDEYYEIIGMIEPEDLKRNIVCRFGLAYRTNINGRWHIHNKLGIKLLIDPMLNTLGQLT